MAEYTNEQLKKLQLVQLEMLKDVLKICKENNLKCFMTAGCAIGIERHKGFIPWDDDIDLGIMREDYEKFVEIVQRDYKDKYHMMSAEISDLYPFQHANMMKNGTVCVPETFEGIRCEFGIDVAFYPFDHVPDDLKKRKKQTRMLFLYSKLRLVRDIKKPYLNMSPFAKKIVYTCCYIAHYAMKVCGISRKWLNNQWLKWAKKYNDIETENVCCFSSTHPLDMMIRLEDLFPLVEKQFEDVMIGVPNKNHEYLTKMYGNYMELPPIEKRKNHAPKILIFGDENNYE